MYIEIEANINELRQTEKAFFYKNAWFPKSVIVKQKENSLVLDGWIVKAKGLTEYKQVNLFDLVDRTKIKPLQELINTNLITYYPEGLMTHQGEAFEFAKGLKSVALFMDMGTGKTKLYINLAEYHYKAKNIDRVVVFCPPTIINNFKQELAKWQETSLQFEVLSLHFLSKNTLKNKEIRDFIAGITNRTMVIVDESHRIKNPESLMCASARQIGFKTNYKIIGTGTPSPNNAIDLVGQGMFLVPKAFPQTKSALKKLFVVGSKGVNRGLKSKNLLSTLTAVLPYCYVLKKEDAIKLPPLSEIDVSCGNSGFVGYYREAKKEAVDIFLSNNGSLMGFLQNLRKLACGFDLQGNEQVVNPKIKELKEILIDIPADKKIIIWHSFYKEIGQILEAIDGGYALLNGDMSDKEKSYNINKFKSDSACRFLISTSAVGGVGLNFTESTVNIFYNNSFNLIDKLQSGARSHRIGQTQPVKIYNLFNKNTIEEKIQKSLAKKIDFMAEVNELFKKRGKNAVIKEIFNV